MDEMDRLVIFRVVPLVIAFAVLMSLPEILWSKQATTWTYVDGGIALEGYWHNERPHCVYYHKTDGTDRLVACEPDGGW